MLKNLMSYAVCDKFQSGIFDHIAERYKTTQYKNILVVHIAEEQLNFDARITRINVL